MLLEKSGGRSLRVKEVVRVGGEGRGGSRRKRDLLLLLEGET